MNITKTAMITVCGRPNVGKSSLTNALVGEKIAIVSDKPQTTRNRIYGVVNRGDTQYVLLDTPGLHKPRSRLGDYMVKVVRESLSDVECALLLVEPIPHVGEPEKVLLQRIREEQLPCVLCINKIDTVEKKEALLEVIAAYSAAYDGFDAIIPISARTGDGLDELMRQLSQYAQEGPQLFPDGMTTDQADSQVCAEIVREKMLRCLDKEIPHGTAVEVTKFSEREDSGIIDLFFALADDPARDDMLLMLDYGTFYEFRDGERIVPLEGVECGRVYAMLITSINGLWRYEIGDTVEFTSTAPYRIRFAGRTRQYINVFGEELIVDNADRALLDACSKTGAVVAEYTVAPCYMSLRERGAHEWVVEFEREPADPERFAGALDEALRRVNSDYDAKRRTTLERQRIHTVGRGYFLRWMRARGKNKVPRLMNDRRVLEDVLAFGREAEAAGEGTAC